MLLTLLTLKHIQHIHTKYNNIQQQQHETHTYKISNEQLQTNYKVSKKIMFEYKNIAIGCHLVSFDKIS